MLQPVEQYSMLSFHDYYQEEGVIIIMLHQIRRLTPTEANRVISKKGERNNQKQCGQSIS
eukprot:scaffold78721_cov47-Cyclotella_meneghiniana.AAC.1